VIIRVALAAGTVACYLAKLAALTAIQTASTGDRLVVDPRLAGVAAGAVALLLRAPFVVVVAVATATAAPMRLW
jgi:hypothetical protein